MIKICMYICLHVSARHISRTGVYALSVNHLTRINNGEKKQLAIVILLASRKCLVTHAELCICTSSQTRCIASTPTPGVHHPRAAEKMWANTFVMISSIILFLKHGASISDLPIDPVYIHEHVCIQCLHLLAYMWSLTISLKKIIRTTISNSHINIGLSWKCLLLLGFEMIFYNDLLV